MNDRIPLLRQDRIEDFLELYSRQPDSTRVRIHAPDSWNTPEVTLGEIRRTAAIVWAFRPREETP